MIQVDKNISIGLKPPASLIRFGFAKGDSPEPRLEWKITRKTSQRHHAWDIPHVPIVFTERVRARVVGGRTYYTQCALRGVCGFWYCMLHVCKIRHTYIYLPSHVSSVFAEVHKVRGSDIGLHKPEEFLHKPLFFLRKTSSRDALQIQLWCCGSLTGNPA